MSKKSFDGNVSAGAGYSALFDTDAVSSVFRKVGHLDGIRGNSALALTAQMPTVADMAKNALGNLSAGAGYSALFDTDAVSSVFRKVGHLDGIRGNSALALTAQMPTGADMAKNLLEGLSLVPIADESANAAKAASLIQAYNITKSWRHGILLESTTASILQKIEPRAESKAVLRRIGKVNFTTAQTSGRVSALNKKSLRSATFSIRPTKTLQQYLSGLDSKPKIEELVFAHQASNGVAGLTTSDLFTSSDKNVVDQETISLVENEIVDPWVTGPQSQREQLFAKLGEIDPHIVELLKGAWAVLEYNVPGATTMAANCAVELLDRVLRYLAPDDSVISAREAGEIAADSVYQARDRTAPTRSGRISYILLRCSPQKEELVKSQTKALSASVTSIQADLQSHKHSSSGTITVLRSHLVSVEAILTQLFFLHGARPSIEG